ncbi:T9SS type A sorting domain-containing protein [Salibacteraceae bacterium]|nr:T9SS type A sorting domain-containing protein [Salibacteraceae bacterium]
MGEIDYTIGQLVYQSFKYSSVSVSQGIHNPIKIKPQGLSNINSKIDLVIYPNPTRSLISVKCDLPSEFIYEIYDLNGRKITYGSFITKTDINLETLSSGVYLLKVYSQENLSQNIFQIIKE